MVKLTFEIEPQAIGALVDGLRRAEEFLTDEWLKRQAREFAPNLDAEFRQLIHTDCSCYMGALLALRETLTEAARAKRILSIDKTTALATMGNTFAGNRGNIPE